MATLAFSMLWAHNPIIPKLCDSNEF